jgi:hypothetical protein
MVGIISFQVRRPGHVGEGIGKSDPMIPMILPCLGVQLPTRIVRICIQRSQLGGVFCYFPPVKCSE